MLFNSVAFLVFFPLVIGLYFVLPHRFRWVLLLVASYYFYMCWSLKYTGLILLSTVIDYYAGILMEKKKIQSERKKYLIISLVMNLGLLAFFKYFNFFNDSFASVASFLIERSTRLIPQFYKKQSFEYQRIADGLKLMAWGFFQKVVIADRLKW